MTCRISRVFGIVTARAASIARSVSSRLTACRCLSRRVPVGQAPLPLTLSLPVFPTPEKVARIAWTLQEMPSDDSDVLEDAPAEGEERDQVEVDPEAVAEERERRREEGVRVEARKEDARVEVPLELGARGAEERVERGEDPDGGVAGPFDREVEAKRQPEKHPGDEAEEREEHLGRRDHDRIRSPHVDVV